jgi:hypothetical protein
MEPYDPSIIFVSIDFEFEEDDTKGKRSTRSIREIGICSLDTRDIEQPSRASHSILSTQNHIWKQRAAKSNGLGPKFFFGESKLIQDEQEIRTVIEQAIVRYDTNGMPRRVVLIGQGLIDAELRSMKGIGINVEDKTQYPWIVDIIDTWPLARMTIPKAEVAHAKFTLKSILESLGIPYKNLHSAGNDANYTMKVFLVLMAQNMRRMLPESSQWSTLVTVQSIALAPMDPESSNQYIKKAEQDRAEAILRAWLRTVPTDIYVPLDCDSPGYVEGMSTSRPVYRIPAHSLDLSSLPSILSGHNSRTLLQTILLPDNKGSSTLSEPSHSHVGASETLLVAFHLSFCSGGKRQVNGRDFSQIETAGFSTFDTGHLKDPLTGTSEILPTKNLTIATSKRGGSFKFLFGESMTLTQKSLIETFRSHILSHNGPSRQVVLVGFDVNHTLCALRNSGFDFLAEFPSLIPIIDIKTLKNAKGIRFDYHGRSAMDSLIRALDLETLPESYLQPAGNITHFLLKSLLMLAARDFHDSHVGEDLNEFQASRIQVLESIARASVKDKLSTLTPDRLAFTRREEERQAWKEMKKEAKKAYYLVRQNNDWEDNLEGGLDIELEKESSNDTSMFVDLFE